MRLASRRTIREHHFAALLWALFLVRGLFFCFALPLWEGWDEYAHFGFVQFVANGGVLPRFDTAFSREVDQSMRLAPLPYELRWMGPPYLIWSEFHALP